MKRTEQILNIFLVILDAVMVFLAFLIAYWARAKSIPLPVVYIWPFDQYAALALKILPVWILGFAFIGLYTVSRPKTGDFGKIIAGASIGAMALVLWVFLNRSDFFSRLIVFYIWAISIIAVGFGRTAFALIQSNLYLLGFRKKRLVIVGQGNENDKRLMKQFKANQSLGYKLIGLVCENKPANGEFKYLGRPDEIEEILKKHSADEVILTDTQIKNDLFFLLMRTCQESGVIFKAVPAHAQVGVRTLQFDASAGIPIIEFKGTALDGWGVVFKRAIDIIGSIIAIVLLSPFILIILIAIKLDSRGPIVYKNKRIGNNGEFDTLKFRTMRIEFCTGSAYGGNRAEEFENRLIKEKNIKAGSAVYKIGDDPRVTRVGKFLRKTSLDELPQFFNVFLGNMSLAGPRPHQPREVEKYTKEQRKLLMIKPGITGLAQISGRSDLSFDEEANLDIFYLENWSFWFDLYIMARTVGVVLFGKGSY